ncbi:MAG: MBOAT family protein [Anaerolineales bacterium]|nr:MBOAT family protein [Anaerolineales bacterium]
MTFLHLGVFALAAIGIGRLKVGRELALLAFSVFVLFWLQPAQPFVSLRFWIPFATLAIIALVWALTAPPEARAMKKNWPTALVIFGVILLIDLNQFFRLDAIYMTATPRLWMLALAWLVFFSVGLALWRVRQTSTLAALVALGILFIFIYLKTPALVVKSFIWMDSLRGVAPATRPLFSWLGFSYIAFRLLHTIRDFQARRLPALTLSEYVNYAIFFPAFVAGPIDRAERFVVELRTPVALAEQDWAEAARRFIIGLFKKFVVADSLAVISINTIFVEQVHSPAWLWLFLYLYALRIYFDFSAYSDIAIGLARVMGIRLPENFAAPYFKPNLTQFWNAWHITLTQWFRAYFFNPLTRALRTKQISIPAIIFVTQLGTMMLIGLWHGVALNFLCWGIWHGLGLFVQNRWSEWARTKIQTPLTPRRKLLADALGMFLTFNFVSLGWLFFTLPTPALALNAMSKLFGFN